MITEAKCVVCGRPATRWCDGLVSVHGRTTADRTDRTCDAPLCGDHAREVGVMHVAHEDRAKSTWDTIDHCPECVSHGGGRRMIFTETDRA